MNRVIPGVLRLASDRTGPTDWTPVLFDAVSPSDRSELADLISSGAVMSVHDTIVDQLAELMETRTPERDLTAREVRQQISRHVGNEDAECYGTWAYYPWSRRLVHVLPDAEFRELRTSTNRNKITASEQAALRRLRIGVVGLSVGQATAVALAMEEIGGELVLADFDTLMLSNMNRIRAAVHEIGLPKAVVAARQIFELNPYARIRIFVDGLTDGNIEAFLADPCALDLLVEECDDLYMKVRVRERARAHRIPVVMETGDRGLFDVERFDREPDRPLLHGLVGDISSETLKGLSTLDKVPMVLRILGNRAVSPRFAASLVEIKTTLKTWPQLASGVCLGAAITADAVRRIALGHFTDSGRYYVDVDGLVGDGLGVRVDTPRPPRIAEEAVKPARLPRVSRVAGDITRDHIETLVAFASLAPSGGNCQPWRFEAHANVIRAFVDPARSVFDGNASYLAVGAAVENLSIAATEMGLACRIIPVAGAVDLVCQIELEVGDSTHDPLFDQIPVRATNRRLGTRTPLGNAAAERLTQAASERGAALTLVTDDESLTICGHVLGGSDRLRYLCEPLHAELMSELRWSPEDVIRTRDGIDIESLELSPADRAGLEVTAAWPVMRLVGELGGGRSLEKPSRKAIASASAVGLLTMPGSRPFDYFAAGRATERVWLTSASLGLALQPMTAVTYLFSRVAAGEHKGLEADAREELMRLRTLFVDIFDPPVGHSEPMLFRITRAAPPSVRSLRRPVHEILNFV